MKLSAGTDSLPLQVSDCFSATGADPNLADGVGHGRGDGLGGTYRKLSEPPPLAQKATDSRSGLRHAVCLYGFWKPATATLRFPYSAGRSRTASERRGGPGELGITLLDGGYTTGTTGPECPTSEGGRPQLMCRAWEGEAAIASYSESRRFPSKERFSCSLQPTGRCISWRGSYLENKDSLARTRKGGRTMPRRALSLAAVAMAVLVVGCRGTASEAELAARIARSEGLDAQVVQRALEQAARDSGESIGVIAKEWAEFRPATPVGETTLNSISANLLEDLRANESRVSASIRELIERLDAEEVMARSICGLAFNALSTGEPPSPRDIALEVALNAFAQDLDLVKTFQMVDDVEGLFREAQTDIFWRARLLLMQYQYCG